MKAGSEPLLFSLDDLILAEDVVKGNLITNVKKKVPVLNITSIYTQVSFMVYYFILILRALVVLTNGKNGTIGRQIPFKVLPMVPLVMPWVPIIPMLPTYGSK